MIATASIDIDAPINVVWSVILDFNSYSEWNPFIYKVSHLPETFDIDSRFLLHIRWANGTTATSWETTTQIIPPSTKNNESTAVLTYRYSSWIAQCGLVQATREQHLSQRAGQLTGYRTQETFHGPLKSFLPLSAVQDGFQRHAITLKQQAELMATRQESANAISMLAQK